MVLTITEAGRTAWQTTMALIHQRNQPILGCMSADEQATLSALLDRLVAYNRSR